MMTLMAFQNASVGNWLALDATIRKYVHPAANPVARYTQPIEVELI